jgi:hypothetical protein
VEILFADGCDHALTARKSKPAAPARDADQEGNYAIEIQFGLTTNDPGGARMTWYLDLGLVAARQWSSGTGSEGR